MGRYNHIIWDWNGTLLDDARACVEVLNQVLRKHDKRPVSYEQYQEQFDFPVKDYYRRLGFDFAVEPYEEIAKEYISAYQKKQFECNLHAETISTLETCRQKGIMQSILSAYNQKMLEEITKFFGVRDFFAKLAGLDDYFAASKVEAGRRLLEGLGITKDKVLLVGDTVHDYKVAREIGTDCVLICNGHQTRQRLQSCGVKVLGSLEELPAILI